MKEANTLVFIYNSYKDPLFQNLMLSYLKTLSAKTNGDFHLITFEQPGYALSLQEKTKEKASLRQYRMYWHPMTFHTGRFLLFKKSWDFLRAFCMVCFLRLRYSTHIIFAFANVAAAFSIVFSRLLRMRMIVYSYEPHADFMEELGYWSSNGLKYKVLHSLEVHAGLRAEYVLTGTCYMRDWLKEHGARGTVYRAPTAVDPDQFYFTQEGRKRVRALIGAGESDVYLYLGKFGGLYYTSEIPKMLGTLLEHRPDSFFLIVTSNDQAEVVAMFSDYMPLDRFFVTGNLPFAEVKDYLSAADVGISGVPPSLAQRYRSPTKVAEYLLCGLPYITTGGVSEDDVWAKRENVGVVVDYFSSRAVGSRLLLELDKLLAEDREVQRKRCRAVGLEYRSKERIDRILEEIYLGKA